MAIPTNPWTPDALREFLGKWDAAMAVSTYNSVLADFFGPRYQTVRYRGALDRVDFEEPRSFYGLGPKSPSDCVWMLPQGVTAYQSK